MHAAEISSFLFHLFFLFKSGAYMTHNATRPWTVWLHNLGLMDSTKTAQGKSASVISPSIIKAPFMSSWKI